MPLSDYAKEPISRLAPYEGLVIDVPTWTAAHDYHRTHQRLHSMAMHSPGVITGLEVVAWDPPDNTVVINPGMAIDADGNVIIVGEPQRFQLQTDEAGIVYLVLQYREVSTSGSGGNGGDSQPRFTLEAYNLQERRQLPDDTYIELGRVQVNGTGAPVTEAADMYNPGLNQIDMRHRVTAGPKSSGSVNVGVIPLEVDSAGQILHAAGAQNLCRAISNTTRYQAEFKGSVNLNQEIANVDLLIMAGRSEFSLADEWVLVLNRFLERGGVLMGESCGAGAGGEDAALPFRQAFIHMAERLGADLPQAERGNPLFNAYHLFAKAPDGADGQALLVSSDSMVFSNGDYGCLWNGGRPDNAASRGSIRDATELGVNVGVYASRRVHARSVRLVAQ